MTLRTTGWVLMVALLGGVVWKLAAQNGPQIKITKGWSFPYIDPKDPMKKMIFSGDEAIPLMTNSGLIKVPHFLMTKFLESDLSKPEFFIEAQDCLFDHQTYTVSSTGLIKAYTADTNYLMEGIGFRWQQSRTNITMIISNKVHTILQRDGSTNAGAVKPPPTHIYSDRFRFESVNDEVRETRVARYSERVRVVDELAELSSDYLTADLPINGTNINVLVAESNVVITMKRDGSKASGDRAVYDTRQGRELLELTGHPTWTDGIRSIRAERFEMDRLRNEMLANGQVRIRLPLESAAPGVFKLPGQAERSASKSTNNLIEITADQARVSLSATNRPGHDLLIEHNIVILSLDDNSRTTADKATFSDATGRLELTGDPKWSQGSNLVSGDVLSVLQSNRSFSAIGHAFVRMEADGLGSFTMPTRKTNTGSVKSSRPTNQIIDIHSDRFDYQTNSAMFSGQVLGGLIVGGKTNLNFTSQNMVLQLTNNQVTRITARDLTLDENPATSANTNLLKRQFRTDLLTIRRSPLTGLIETMTAEGGVSGEQVEQGQGTNAPVRQSGQADLVVVQFNAKTNKVDGVIAERNVILQKDNMELHSDRTVYVVGISNRVVEMTGNIWGSYAATRITNTPVVLWNLENGKFSAPQGWGIIQGLDKDLKNIQVPISQPAKTPP